MTYLYFALGASISVYLIASLLFIIDYKMHEGRSEPIHLLVSGRFNNNDGLTNNQKLIFKFTEAARWSILFFGTLVLFFDFIVILIGR